MTAPNNYPTISNGAPVDADAWFNPVAQDLSAVSNFFSGGGWTAYTPVFSWGSGSLTIGNGSFTGGYRRLGSIYLIRATINSGTTTAWSGTGGNEANFSLPPGLNWGFGTFFAGSGNFWGTGGYSIIAPNGGLCYFRLVGGGNFGSQAPFTPGTSKAGFGLMIEAPTP